MRGWKDIRLTRFHTAGLWGDVDDDVILSHRRLWLHEASRVIMDRLIEEPDQEPV